MERSDSFSSILVVLFSGFYSFVFILSTVGNIWVLVTCYKTLKQRHSPFMWLLANLASADLCFTILTIFNSIAFLWQWVGGNITCKLQGFLIEASYTSTIITLLTISYERLKVTSNPINALVKRWPEKQYFKLIIIWSCSLLICLPLLFIYRVETQQNSVMCLARKRTNFFPQIFYSVHTTIFFVAPLVYMIYTQSCIFRTLRVASIPTTAFITHSKQRQRKIAKTLSALTIAFVICWSPFMVIRTLIYFSLASPDFAWKMSQLLIFLNSGLDPLLYGYYGGHLTSCLRPRLTCSCQ